MKAKTLHDGARRAKTPHMGAPLKFIVRIVVALMYPALILGAWHWGAPRYVGVLLIVLLILQRRFGAGIVARSLRQLTLLDGCIALLMVCLSLAIVVTNSALLLRFYPVFVNLGFLVAFGATLVRGPSMVEKFARLREPSLTPEAVRYTRRVTQIWCGFFVLNAAFSAYTALCWSRAAWSIYNGGIAYLLIGALVAGEFAWRRVVVLPRVARAHTEAG